MPRFIVARSLNRLTSEQVASIQSGCPQASDGIVWVRSYISEADGKLYCEYDAPSAEAVLAASRAAGLPVDRIAERSVEINPDMFR